MNHDMGVMYSDSNFEVSTKMLSLEDSPDFMEKSPFLARSRSDVAERMLIIGHTLQSRIIPAIKTLISFQDFKKHVSI